MIMSPFIPVHTGIQIARRATVGVGLRIVDLIQHSRTWIPVCTGMSGMGLSPWL